MLELRPEDDKEDVEAGGDGDAGNDDRSDDDARLIADVRNRGDGALTDVVCRVKNAAIGPYPSVESKESRAFKKGTHACQRRRSRR
jgi:hypothetical protein